MFSTGGSLSERLLFFENKCKGVREGWEGGEEPKNK